MPAKGIAQSNYELKKQRLIEQVKQCHAKNQPITLRKQTSNLFRHHRLNKNGIDVRELNQVIEIDPDNLTANVEAMTSYETLVNECLKYNCLPTVVPELKTITVGGALSGCGIESSSFKYGLVHETIKEIEVLLSDGRVVLCTPENEHHDLFFGFPNSYGTLGYALRLTLMLYPIKPYIKLSHQQVTDKKDYFNILEELCLQGRAHHSIDFIEGVIFDKNNLYITTAQFVDQAPYLSDYTYRSIYYRSIKQRQEDYLTVHDYIWRWDTDWFWCSKFFYAQNPFIRTLLGKNRLNSASYWRIRHFFSTNKLAKWIYNLFKEKTESIIQDIQIPINKSSEFLDFFESNIDIKPVWICPVMPYQNGINFDLYSMNSEQLYMNFGFWDVKPIHDHDGYYNQLIEEKTDALSGKKSLYSTLYYPEEKFWQIYNKSSYDKLKKKYDNKGQLKSLFEKCSVK